MYENIENAAPVVQPVVAHPSKRKPPSLKIPLIGFFVSNHRVYLVNRGSEAAELDFGRVQNVARVGIGPLFGSFDFLVRVHEQVEGAGFLQERKEGDTSGDLTNDGLDFVVDLLDGLGTLRGIRVGSLVFGTVLLHRYVELPAFESLHRIDPLNDNYEALNRASEQPFRDLFLNVVKVVKQTLVGGRHDGQAILGLTREGFGHVDTCCKGES